MTLRNDIWAEKCFCRRDVNITSCWYIDTVANLVFWLFILLTHTHMYSRVQHYIYASSIWANITHVLETLVYLSKILLVYWTYRICPCISRGIYPRTKYYTDNSSYTRVAPSGKKLYRKQVEFSKCERTMTQQWWAIMHELMNIQSPH